MSRAAAAAVLASLAMLTSLVAGCTPSLVFPSLTEDLDLGAELFLPRAEPPYPAVVLLAPCMGIGPFMRQWAKGLADAGIAAAIVDSFTPRGTSNVCEYGSPHVEEVALDAVAALHRLRSDDRIDHDRLAVLGWSHGGSAALEVNALERFYGEPDLRAVVAVYPGCETLDPATRVPTLLLLAGEDDWTPPRACLRLASIMRAEDRPVSVDLYEHATHSFDQPGAPHTYLGHRLVYDPGAAGDAHERVAQFLFEQFAFKR